MVAAMRDSRLPVIACINGVAAGAGINIAVACDIRIAASTATSLEAFVKVGLHPDWGGTYFLPRLVGPSRAMWMMTTGETLSAKEALEIGLVDEVVAPEELENATPEARRADCARAARRHPQHSSRRCIRATTRIWRRCWNGKRRRRSGASAPRMCV